MGSLIAHLPEAALPHLHPKAHRTLATGPPKYIRSGPYSQEETTEIDVHQVYSLLQGQCCR